ncbi:hypothetical protein HZY88_08300 [Aerococcaceae bacterium DSM 111176]|nr:hypothetical protein [Aerococcaceae bacterium DSM 111176]
MISIISYISAIIAFVYLGILGIKDLPELVQDGKTGTITLNVAAYLFAFLVPMFLLIFGFIF